MADEADRGREPPTKNPTAPPDQSFFLDLAMRGRDVWNDWRRDPANNEIRVTFAGVDFSATPKDQIDFSRFDFGDYADFSNCKWRSVTLEELARGPSGFKTHEFQSGRAFFPGATFGRGTNFNCARLGDWAVFSGGTFDQDLDFRDAIFDSHAMFDYANIGLLANFTGATFGDGASFCGTGFWIGIKFNQAHFKGSVSFSGQTEECWNKYVIPWIAKAFMAFEERHKALWERYDSRPDRFKDISFSGALFEGQADFSYRSFGLTTDFSDARFYSPPVFDNVTGTNRIDFTGTRIGFSPKGRFIHLTADSSIVLRLRALRKVVEETKNHDLERDLYIEERKAERGVYWIHCIQDLKKASIVEKPLALARLLSHGLWIAVMFFYGALADYGRSFVLPVVWLFLSVWLFQWAYASALAPLKQKAYPASASQYEQAVRSIAFSNAVPFVGPLTVDAETKKFLFCASEGSNKCLPLPPEGFQRLVIAQNALSIMLFFFIGLALRNYFKIK